MPGASQVLVLGTLAEVAEALAPGADLEWVLTMLGCMPMSMMTQEELLWRFGPVEDPEIEARRQRILDFLLERPSSERASAASNTSETELFIVSENTTSWTDRHSPRSPERRRRGLRTLAVGMARGGAPVARVCSVDTNPQRIARTSGGGSSGGPARNGRSGTSVSSRTNVNDQPVIGTFARSSISFAS
jgi:hypothetical protein